MVKEPLISVLLPVYNAAPYVKEAIESILNQTYQHLELIVIDDGSTDDSGQVVGRVRDPRIRIFHQANQGLPAALNQAIQTAQGAYVARQDADDIALPKRFEKQVEFLETHQDCGIVGTWAEIRSENKALQAIHKHPSDYHILKFELLFDNPFVHSSMMIRKSVFDRVGLYSTDKSVRPAEDYELWSRAAREFEVANIPEVLQIYRDTPGSMSKGVVNPFLESVINISINNLAWVTERDTRDPAIIDLAALAHAAYHRVIGIPTFQDLTSLLFEAADRLSDGCRVPRDVLRRRAHEHSHNIRYQYQYFQDSQRNGVGSRVMRWARALKRAASASE